MTAESDSWKAKLDSKWNSWGLNYKSLATFHQHRKQTFVWFPFCVCHGQVIAEHFFLKEKEKRVICVVHGNRPVFDAASLKSSWSQMQFSVTFDEDTLWQKRKSFFLRSRQQTTQKLQHNTTSISIFFSPQVHTQLHLLRWGAQSFKTPT